MVTCRPLREDELLTSRIHQYPSPESGLLNKKSSKKNKTEKSTGEKSVKKKKDKKSKNKDLDLMISDSKQNNIDEENMLIENVNKSKAKHPSKSNSAEDINVANHVKSTKTEKHKKSKKEVKEKDSKKKKSSKKG